ncbi:DUF3613 domain-containing protein [Dyella agri]|uniref:DUF3613 domain-containing protein n=2 Tax=Dyella agri TaxID=1926869 RepID=A0ABW8KMJ9_9GAMM
MVVALMAACLLTASPRGMAQQQPLTGRMMGHGAAAPSPAPSAAAAPSATPSQQADANPASAPAFRANEVGDTTRYLLGLQADDDRPGTRLPMLGNQASAGYDRYMKSFNHGIPEFYESSVGKNGSGGR